MSGKKKLKTDAEKSAQRKRSINNKIKRITRELKKHSPIKILEDRLAFWKSELML